MSVLFPGETLVWSFLFSYKHTALFEASARVASCRLLLIILTGESRWQLPHVISLRETWAVVAKLAARVNETLHKQPSAVIVEEESAVWSRLPGLTSVSVTWYRLTESGLTSVSVTYRCWGGVCSLVSSSCFNVGFTDAVPTDRVGSFVSSSWFNVGFIDVVPMLIKEESAVLSLPGFTSVSLTWYRCWRGICSFVSSLWFYLGFTDVVSMEESAA